MQNTSGFSLSDLGGTSDIFGSISPSSQPTFGSGVKSLGSRTRKTANQPQPSFGQQPSQGVQPQQVQPASTNALQVSAWNTILGKTGKKDSKKFVTALNSAWQRAGLTTDEIFVLMQRFKQLPIAQDEGGIRAQQATNMDKARLVQNLTMDQSKPLIQQNQTLTLFISAVNKLRAALGSSTQALSWGTLSRIDYIAALGPKFTEEFKKLVPSGREFLMRKMFPNLVDFKVGLRVYVERWTCFMKAMALLRSVGKFNLESAGFETEDGRKVISPFLRFFPDQDSLNEITKIEIDSEDAAMAISEVIDAADLDAGWYLSGANCPDFRFLMQCADVKQSKNNTQFMAQVEKAIATKMLNVIVFAGFGDKLVDQPINLLADGWFCKLYFFAKAFCGATLRGINIALYGINGGADTRSRVLRRNVQDATPETKAFTL